MHSRSCWHAGAQSCCGAITGRDSAGCVTHASAAHRFPLFMIGPEGTTKATDVLLPFSSGAFVGGGPVLPVLLKYRSRCSPLPTVAFHECGSVRCSSWNRPCCWQLQSRCLCQCTPSDSLNSLPAWPPHAGLPGNSSPGG